MIIASTYHARRNPGRHHSYEGIRAVTDHLKCEVLEKFLQWYDEKPCRDSYTRDTYIISHDELEMIRSMVYVRELSSPLAADDCYEACLNTDDVIRRLRGDWSDLAPERVPSKTWRQELKDEVEKSLEITIN